MSHRVTLQPSGHSFRVEPGEVLLDAALRAGLNLRYSCNSGSCGACMARLLAGELDPVGHHDFVIPEAERARGAFLMCRATAASDLLVEAGEARSAADIPRQRLTATVSRLTPLSGDVLEVQLRTPRSRTLMFLAGQHVTLRLPGVPPRNKSIASCPCNGMLLQFHVRRVPGDPFSEYVHSRLKLRQKVELEGPWGDFVLDEDSRRPLMFLAFETGFAPIKSLIEHAIALELPQPMRLYWVARDDCDHYLANQCRAWQDALDDFHFIPVAGAAGETDWLPPEPVPGLPAELDSAARALLHGAWRMTQDFPDVGPFDIYANGPVSVMTAARALLRAHGLREDRLFVDEFERFPP